MIIYKYFSAFSSHLYVINTFCLTEPHEIPIFNVKNGQIPAISYDLTFILENCIFV